MAGPHDVSDTFDESFKRLNDSVDRIIAERVKDAQRLNRIAMVLRRFYLEDFTRSSAQPVLDLAVELNPCLAHVDRARAMVNAVMRAVPPGTVVM